MGTMRWIVAYGAVLLPLGVGYGCRSQDGPAETVKSASSADVAACLQHVLDVCDGETKNHGDCVSCVAHAVKDMECSDLTGAQRGQLVADFAHGDPPYVCPSTCVPKKCADLSAECGSIPDQCGGTISCGTCPTGEICGHDHVCDTPPCVPMTCAELGIGCGQVPDACGGMLDCGGCAAPETCGGGGTPSVCGCTPKTCADIECGSADDGCGQTLDCGDTCPTGETCQGNVCDQPCVPKTCTDLGFTCGTADDGCGNQICCGDTCPSGQTCQSNVCM